MFLEIKTEKGEVRFLRAAHIDEISIVEDGNKKYHLRVRTNNGKEIIVAGEKTSPEELIGQYKELKQQFNRAIKGISFVETP